MSSIEALYASSAVIDGAAGGDLSLEAEVCVIGSGAGGAVAASVLQAAGFEVLVVEEGGLHTRKDFTMKERDVYPKLYQDGLQRASADLGVSILQGRTVGGTTVVNWTTSFRTPEHVVDHWRAHHAVGGVDSAALAPHFEVMERRLAIRAVDDAMINANNRALADGLGKLGWQVERLRRNVHACLSSGYCGMGCAFNAKRSMLVTMIPEALEAGARLLHRARIERLELSGDRVVRAHGTLLGADGWTPNGRKLELRAKTFVLAAGAINGPALLLRSGLEGVGARTFLHPAVVVRSLFPHPIEAWSGAPQSIASHQFSDRGDKVGLFLEAGPLHPVIGATVMTGVGAAHAEGMAELPNTAGHIAIMIDGFHEGSPGGVVKLRPSGAPTLDYPLTPALAEAARFGIARLAEIGFAAGATKVATLHEPPYVMRSSADVPGVERLDFAPGALSLFSAHVMGGAAMGDDPKRSVVRSSDLRHHALQNLYVMDGSVFPTSLGVNPQLSIYGLVHLMATRLVEASSTRHAAPTQASATPVEADPYASRCAPCHGAEGRGDGPLAAHLPVKPRDLSDPAWQGAVSDEAIAKVIAEGGLSVGKSPLMGANPDLAGTPALDALVRKLRGLVRR